jgi:dTDP-4-amino-4,6-dideoxygalactose transaminase
VIPFVDVGRENRSLIVQLREAADRVFASGRVLMGPEVEAFEHEIAEWYKVKHAVAVASGTDAVEIGLRATDHKFDSCATTTAFTAVPTINAIEAAGLMFSLDDVNPHTRNTEGRAECVKVHLFGLASPAKHSCVEDCAHSMGAVVNGKLAGTMGRCGALSFYPTKILGALGDGGAIITNDDGMAERAREIRHYGFNGNCDIKDRGQNSRMSELQAAFLRVKLPYVESWIDKRIDLAEIYTAELAGRVVVPFTPSGSKHVFHCYVIEHPERDRIAAALKQRGIGTMIHYPKSINQYDRWRGHGSNFPNAQRLAATVLSLPCYPFLAEQEQDVVIAAVKDLT